jgi:hypothetical protein
MTFLFTVFNLSGARSFGGNVSDGDKSGRPLRITFAGFLPTVRRLPAVALASYFN